MCSYPTEIELQDSGLRPDKPVICPSVFPILENTVDYDAFFRNHLENNIPCLIRNYKPMKNWQSCTDWVDIHKNIPNLGYFEKIIDIDTHSVPVSNCGKRYFNSQEKCNMTFKLFMNEWKLSEAQETSNLYYLKDWHFVKEVPQYNAYQTPHFFVSDWLNEYLEDFDEDLIVEDNFHTSDYKFVYIGPQGSWTPFHSDVFGSFSWSANIVGEKEWIFFPPGYEKYLIDPSTHELFYNICDIIPSGGEFLERLTFTYKGNEIIYYKILQKPNEIIFVPSLWHHQVTNTRGAISINHNWFNATNIKLIWKILTDELDKVKTEISDCRSTCKNEEEWNDMCQNLLRTSHGMNIADFLHICNYIRNKRIAKLENASGISIKTRFDTGLKHTLYELKALKSIYCDVAKKSFSPLCETENLEISIDSINEVLSRYEA